VLFFTSLHKLSRRFYEKNERSGDTPDVTHEGQVFFPFRVLQKFICCVLLHLRPWKLSLLCPSFCVWFVS